MKKVLSLFIVAALIFGLLPLTAFAADTDIAETGTPINRVDVTGVIPPVPGNKPAYDISIPEDANYTVESVFWYTTDQAYIPPDTVFEAGKDYMIGVEVAPKDGYEFTDTVTGTVNGSGDNVQMWSDGSINVRVMGTFQCRTTNIYSIPVTDLAIPATGEKPSYTAAVPSDAHYQIDDFCGDYVRNGMEWFDADGNIMDPRCDTFDAGKEYTVKVFLTPASADYEFYGYYLMDATVNGEKAKIRDVKQKQSVSVEYTFTCQEEQSVPGDADGDGETTALDVTCIQRYNVHISTGLERKIVKNSDIDGNGLSEIIDATYIQRHLAQMETPYGIGK